MSREIKFEYGFESVNGIVKKVYHLHEIPNIQQICDVWNELPVKYTRQFTGLLDKNGKEIYESDICTFYNKYSKKTYTRVVRYCPMLACFGLYPNMEEVWNYESDWLKIQDVEIIGNIYESKKFLNH